MYSNQGSHTVLTCMVYIVIVVFLQGFVSLSHRKHTSLLTCVNVAISILVSVCFSDNITSIWIIDDGLLNGYCSETVLVPYT